MELNKYYTPELEEIFNSPELIYSENIHINPYVYRDETKIINLKEDFDINIVKVKYLDQEDIESLGWDTDDNGQCYNKTVGFTLYGLYPWENNNEYKITIESNTVFLGVIKNKSELIKLLKQLKI